MPVVPLVDQIFHQLSSNRQNHRQISNSAPLANAFFIQVTKPTEREMTRFFPKLYLDISSFWAGIILVILLLVLFLVYRKRLVSFFSRTISGLITFRESLSVTSDSDYIQVLYKLSASLLPLIYSQARKALIPAWSSKWSATTPSFLNSTRNIMVPLFLFLTRFIPTRICAWSDSREVAKPLQLQNALASLLSPLMTRTYLSQEFHST